MIKVEAKDGCVAFQADGTVLEQAHEVLAIRQFLEQHQEIERMADLIEKSQELKRKDVQTLKNLIGRIEEFAVYGMFLLFLIKAFTFAVGIDLW